MDTETTQLNAALAAELTKRSEHRAFRVFGGSLEVTNKNCKSLPHGIGYLRLFTDSFDTLRLLEDLLTRQEWFEYSGELKGHEDVICSDNDMLRLSALDRCRALVRVLDLKIEGGV